MYFVKNSISGAQQMLDKILCFHKTKSIPTSEQADAKIICQKSKHCCTNSVILMILIIVFNHCCTLNAVVPQHLLSKSLSTADCQPLFFQNIDV